jgi:hypothetical protein
VGQIKRSYYRQRLEGAYPDQNDPQALTRGFDKKQNVSSIFCNHYSLTKFSKFQEISEELKELAIAKDEAIYKDHISTLKY